MTKYPSLNVDFGLTKPVWEERRGRPISADAERKADVIKRAAAALVSENYMDTAAKFQDEYYAEDSVKDDGTSANYEKRYNQQKHVAKNIREEVRKRASFK
ncbi:hypothetical protein [Blastomonas sp.]|uniref:hypothetical protein n=1 Tax=Blastomonas sp. TaxID=1909299 RepID=UPI0026182D3F|nr:hypothetical protein [Blastomonas sp.]MDM7956596.1 hypothetical protein [Blastomonas sp.]